MSSANNGSRGKRPQTTNNGSAKRLMREPVGSASATVHPEASNNRILETKKLIGRFFYENAMDFDVAKSPSFESMVLHGFGPDVQIPTSEELKGWILQDALKEMHVHINEIKSSWVETGCSILLDGWTSTEGRSLLNIFVDCPKGAIYLRSCDVSDFHQNVQRRVLLIGQAIEDVGVENVVQIVTYSGSNLMKEIGDTLMEKYTHLFWSVDTSYCIELILEKYGEMVNQILDKTKTITNFIRRDADVLKLFHEKTNSREGLIFRAKTRLAHMFLTLDNVVSEEETLRSIFLSSAPQTLTEEGRSVANLVMGNSFWSEAKTVAKITVPLVHGLELMHDNKLPMDWVYETIDEAKENIRKLFHNKSEHKPFWETIDDVWNSPLHSDLHAAGHYLNPKFFYAADKRPTDEEVYCGLFTCISSQCDTPHATRSVHNQLKLYRTGSGAFAEGSEVINSSKISSVNWWQTYGKECPELQRFAIRILSQTCLGASKFQLKRSLAETLLKKRTNQFQQQKLSDLACVYYHMNLKNFAAGKSGYIDAIDDWVVGVTHM